MLVPIVQELAFLMLYIIQTYTLQTRKKAFYVFNKINILIHVGGLFSLHQFMPFILYTLN